MKEDCRTMIKVLTKKDHVIFTTRCNESIRMALQIAASLGKSLCLYQDEGGWLTYEKYIVRSGLEPIKMVTDDGLIHSSELAHYNIDAVLLLNSMAGYVALHDMDDIQAICTTHDVFLINDVAGSIGTDQAKQGDVIVGSFGKAKPVNLGTGGFIAFDDIALVNLFHDLNAEYEEPDINYHLLADKLKKLDTRRAFLLERAEKIRQDLSSYSIVHPEKKGLNVIVRFDDDDTKQKIVSYCNDNNLEYTQCPREIRIDDDAISIEVKRLV